MRKRFCCRQGHRWEVSLDNPIAVAVECIICPACGAPAETVAPPESMPAVDPKASTDHATPEAPAALAGGDGISIAGYEILALLGQGGMGVVYQACQIELKRVVALKMLLPQPHVRLEQLERFRAEAEAAARLQHPHIVQIYEIGDQGGRPYITLEFVDGGGLDKKLAGAPQSAQYASELLEPLARAMHVAHQRGIVHRDLKPANVLLTADGVPKITDFGLAKQLDAEGGQTRSGAVLGTPSYMAPEQADGRKEAVGPCSDVYGLGAILYEVVTGRPPFRGTTLLETLEQVRSQEPVPPRRLQPNLPRDLETICLKCLQKEPRQRYVSALALADDLRRFRNQEPIHAHPIGPAERFWRWCRRKPALASLTAALVLLAISAFFAVTGLWLIAERHRLLAEDNALKEEQQRRRAEDNAFKEAQQRRRAEINLDGARDAILQNVRVAFEFLQRKEAGTIELRRKLLESALTSVTTLRARNSQDRSLRMTDAGVHFFWGDLNREIGSLPKALSEYQMAQKLVDGVLAEDLPELARRSFQAMLATCYKCQGGVLAMMGRHDEALVVGERAITLQKALDQLAPHTPQIQSDLGEMFNDLGVLQSHMGRPEKALDCYRQALAVQEELVSHRPDVAEYQSQLAYTYFNRGCTEMEIGQADAALRSLQQALAIHDKLVNDHPAHLGYHSARGETWNSIGMAWEQLGQPEKAVAAYQQAITDQRQAFDKAAQVLEYRQHLSVHYRNLAAVQRRLGRPAEAADASRKRGRLWPNKPAELCQAAWELALCAPLVAKGKTQLNPAELAERQQYLDEARKMLRQALRRVLGLRLPLEKDVG